jgi:hypothetical protein
MRQLTQSLLDIRKQLSEAGWQIKDNDDNTAGTAVQAVKPAAASTADAAASNSSTAIGGPADMSSSVMLLLLRRESLLAEAELQVMQSSYMQEGAVLQRTKWQTKQASAEQVERGCSSLGLSARVVAQGEAAAYVSTPVGDCKA